MTMSETISEILTEQKEMKEELKKVNEQLGRMKRVSPIIELDGKRISDSINDRLGEKMLRSDRY